MERIFLCFDLQAMRGASVAIRSRPRRPRARSRELAETRGTMQGMLAAAQALPDGVVTLNEDFQIEWCNRVARHHLGLSLPADRGHNLLNLLRAPEFVAYAHRDDWPEPILVRLAPGGQARDRRARDEGKGG